MERPEEGGLLWDCDCEEEELGGSGRGTEGAGCCGARMEEVVEDEE